MAYRVAVVGATGAVGREMLKTLVERNFPVSEIAAVASGRSAGTEVRRAASADQALCLGRWASAEPPRTRGSDRLPLAWVRVAPGRVQSAPGPRPS